MLEKSFNLSSRAHLFPILNTSQTTFYIKREDEIGGLASGTKLRKYASLLPYIEKNQLRPVLSWGSAYSNHLLALSSFLKQKKIPFHFFILEASGEEVGNALFLKMISEENLIPISREAWPEIEKLVEEKAETFSQTTPFICPEGAFCKESLPGAMTLAEDIQRNEQELGIEFSDIFIDAGTGLSAMALLFGLKKKKKVHILLLAEEEKVFLEKLKALQKETGLSPAPFSLYRPSKLKSFGSHSKKLFKIITRVAHEEGILLDPVYNGKMFLFLEEEREKFNLGKHALMIHSGGTLSLSGFQNFLNPMHP